MKNLEKKDKVLLLIGVILAIMCTLVIILFRLDDSVKTFSEDYIEANQDEYRYYFDECAYEGDYIWVQGWIYKIDNTVGIYDTRVVLKDRVTGVCYELPTMYVSRPDVESEKHSGFFAKGKIKGLQKNIENFDIYIYYNNNKKNSLIYIGELINETK